MSADKNTNKKAGPDCAGRRKFLKGMAAGAATAAVPTTALAAAGKSFFPYASWGEYFQKRFQDMSPEEVKASLARLEKKYTEQFGKKVTVKATPPKENVVFGYALNLGVCIGCRRCVHACVAENNQSREHDQIQYINVLRFEDGVRDIEESEKYYEAEKVPEEGHYYMPVQCQHCENPPCVRACPIKATWQEDDGLVVVDYNWCIGCRYCMAACPYDAREFNWFEPTIPAEEMNPETHYLGNRPRMRGVVEKCTFCIQRTREGKFPACHAACPAGARKFGNLLDPNSEIRKVIDNHQVFRLKEELSTEPKFFYYFG